MWPKAQKMAIDPVRGVRKCSEKSQMKAETEILIYKLVLVAKTYVLRDDSVIADLVNLLEKIKKQNVSKAPKTDMSIDLFIDLLPCQILFNSTYCLICILDLKIRMV